MCGYLGADALCVRLENCENPSGGTIGGANVVVQLVAREARCSTMTEQHGDGHKPTTFPTE